jgi:hypothetical protein
MELPLNAVSDRYLLTASIHDFITLFVELVL